MKAFSMFSGIGGFELGIQMASEDIELIGYSEIDKYAIQVYEKHFQEQQIMETQLQLMENNSQTLTSWLEDFLAKHSAWLESEKDSTRLEELSF